MQALRGAGLSVAPGEVHALLGENGAGKTTLMHVAHGLERADAGRVLIGGVPRRLASPRDARRAGVGMVHQHPTSVPALTVAENVALAAGWAVQPTALRGRVRALGERLGLPLDPDTPAERLSIALKQRLEILKALATDARVLLLDEPTSVLAPAEAKELLGMVRRFAKGGGAVVLITHKLAEAFDAADRVTVLRRGVVTYSGSPAEESPKSLAAHMIGADLPDAAPRVSRAPGLVLVHVEALDVPRMERHGTGLRGASLDVREGEIVGIAAVEGNGQQELLRAVAGLVRPLRGVLEVTRPTALIPEDRTTEGLVAALSLTQNVTLGLGRGAPWIRGKGLHRIDWGEAERRTAQLLADFDVQATGPGARAAELSGGNQQKVVIARAMERKPRVVIAENPTRGLDVRAAAFVHERLRRAARAGAGVLFHSTDLDEVLALADRILVMADGRIRAAPAGATRSEVGAMMLGVGQRRGGEPDA